MTDPIYQVELMLLFWVGGSIIGFLAGFLYAKIRKNL